MNYSTEQTLSLAAAIAGATAGANLWHDFATGYTLATNPDIWVETLREELRACCYDEAHTKKALNRVKVYAHACRKACAAGIDPTTVTKDQAAVAKPAIEGEPEQAEPAPAPKKVSKSQEVTVEIPDLCASLVALIQSSSLTADEWKALRALADAVNTFEPHDHVPTAVRVDAYAMH